MKEVTLVIPRLWYKKLVNQNGRSDWLAIAILAELLRLTDDKIHISTNYFIQLYGASRVCVRRAIKRLKAHNLIHISLVNGDIATLSLSITNIERLGVDHEKTN